MYPVAFKNTFFHQKATQPSGVGGNLKDNTGKKKKKQSIIRLFK